MMLLYIPTFVTLQVPSLTGKEDDEMEGDQLMFDLDQGFAQGFTQEQVDGMYHYVVLNGQLGNLTQILLHFHISFHCGIFFSLLFFKINKNL